jgi:hypothetical protein
MVAVTNFTGEPTLAFAGVLRCDHHFNNLTSSLREYAATQSQSARLRRGLIRGFPQVGTRREREEKA